MSTVLATPSRIALIDDHAIVRFGYSQLIECQRDLRVCGTAETEQQGMDLIRDEKPDLAIVDLSLKEGHGMDLLKSIARHFPRTKSLVISAHDEVVFAQRVLAAGALGYLNKQEATERLIEAIRAVLSGEIFFSRQATSHLLSRRIDGDSGPATDSVQCLTDREVQVFEKIGKGCTTREIAEEMVLSLKTVERYKENIKRKLRIQNATQLVFRATQWATQNGR